MHSHRWNAQRRIQPWHRLRSSIWSLAKRSTPINWSGYHLKGLCNGVSTAYTHTKYIPFKYIPLNDCCFGNSQPFCFWDFLEILGTWSFPYQLVWISFLTHQYYMHGGWFFPIPQLEWNGVDHVKLRECMLPERGVKQNDDSRPKDCITVDKWRFDKGPLVRIVMIVKRGGYATRKSNYQPTVLVCWWKMGCFITNWFPIWHNLFIPTLFPSEQKLQKKKNKTVFFPTKRKEIRLGFFILPPSRVSSKKTTKTRSNSPSNSSKSFGSTSSALPTCTKMNGNR